VYTERVGGSSPSPPTSRRRRFRRIAALGLIFAVAGSLAPAVHAESSSMTFRVQPLQTGGCGARCPHVIVADGVIETDTPQAFVDFLKSGSSDTNLRRIVFFNSRGGNVVASMVFGHLLRELRVAGIVGRFEDGREAGPYTGECLSACVYAMMGAVRRIAPPGSEVALHRMSIVESEGGGWGGPAHVTRSFADAPMVAVLQRYARRMGVDPALVRTAESLPPDSVHILTRGEMRRWLFATGQF
ncbi:MAG: hypothetical protein WBQ45_25690, partial [Roseiarcus sp.]